MWRDADTEARDLKSNAVIARDVRDRSTGCEGAESVALRALAAALRVWLDCGGVRDPHRRDLHDTTVDAPGQRRNEGELPRPSHKCDLELRGGIVKAAARRVERSESLERRRAQLDPAHGDGRLLARMIVEKYSAFREGSAARSNVTTRVHSARRSQRESASIPAGTSGA